MPGYICRVLRDITSHEKNFPINSPLLRHLPSLHCRQSIPPENASAVSLCAAVLSQQSGGYYIAGGIPRLERASTDIIQSVGGRVVFDADVLRLAINDKNSCEGVVLSNGTLIRAKSGVISGVGAIRTLTRMLRPEAFATCKSLLANIEEQRPKIKVCVSTSEAKLLGCDTMIVSRKDLDEEKFIYGNTLWMWSPTAKSGISTSKYICVCKCIFAYLCTGHKI